MDQQAFHWQCILPKPQWFCFGSASRLHCCSVKTQTFESGPRRCYCEASVLRKQRRHEHNQHLNRRGGSVNKSFPLLVWQMYYISLVAPRDRGSCRNVVILHFPDQRLVASHQALTGLITWPSCCAAGVKTYMPPGFEETVQTYSHKTANSAEAKWNLSFFHISLDINFILMETWR